MPVETLTEDRSVDAMLYRFLGLATLAIGLFVGLIPAVQAMSEGAPAVPTAVWASAGISFIALGIYWAGSHANLVQKANRR